jgi:linoleate 9S-lipoxygenase
MLSGIIDGLTGANKHARLKGTVVLMRKNVLDLNDFGATVVDSISEFLGKGVTCQLISSTLVDASEYRAAPPAPLRSALPHVDRSRSL